MRFLLYVIPIVLLLGPALVAGDDDRPPTGTFAAERFYRDVRRLVRRHYRDATAHRLGNKIHFEHDTRIFIVHEPLRTGEWQDPWEERGPKKGGVHCDIEYRPGPYGGAAAVPQTFDKRYFTVSLLAPHSDVLGGHLYVRLKLPGFGSVPEGFREAFEGLVEGFEVYADG